MKEEVGRSREGTGKKTVFCHTNFESVITSSECGVLLVNGILHTPARSESQSSPLLKYIEIVSKWVTW